MATTTVTTTVSTTSTTITTTRSTTTTTESLRKLWVKETNYDFKRPSFETWKKRFLKLKQNFGSRVRRTDSPARSLNEIKQRADNAAALMEGMSTPKPVPSLPPVQRVSPKPEYVKPNDPERKDQKHKWHAETSEIKTQFRSRGKMIGSLNFAHIVLDIDLKGYFGKVRGLCGRGESWARQMNTTGVEGQSFFIDMIERYENHCHRLLYDVEEAEHVWLRGQLTDTIPRVLRHTTLPRVKRQFFLAGLLIGAAVVAITSYYFSNSALLDISYGNSQNPITIRHLQDHENRITKNERSIKILKTHLIEVGKTVDELYEETQLFHVLLTIDGMISDLTMDTYKFLEGLRKLHSNRFSDHLVETSQIVPILQELKLKLASLNLVPTVVHSKQMYELETSHIIFENGTVRVFVHLPTYRQNSLMDVHEFVSTPVHLGDGHFAYPQPYGKYLASNQGNNLFKVFTDEEFTKCDEIEGTHYCRNTNWYEKRYQDNCLINLYLHDTQRIKDHCHFLITKQDESVTQINFELFNLFSLQPVKLNYKCPGETLQTDSYEFDGAQEIRIRPACLVDSPGYLMEGAADVFMDITTVKFEDLDIFSAEDLVDLRQNFHSIPEKALELVGKQQGLKITDIKAEFAAQKLANHIRIGLVAGVLGLLILSCCIFLCVRCCPCKKIWTWVFTAPKQKDKKKDKKRRRKNRRQSQDDNSDETMEMVERGRSIELREPTVPPAYKYKPSDLEV